MKTLTYSVTYPENSFIWAASQDLNFFEGDVDLELSSVEKSKQAYGLTFDGKQATPLSLRVAYYNHFFPQARFLYTPKKETEEEGKSEENTCGILKFHMTTHKQEFNNPSSSLSFFCDFGDKMLQFLLEEEMLFIASQLGEVYTKKKRTHQVYNKHSNPLGKSMLEVLSILKYRVLKKTKSTADTSLGAVLQKHHYEIASENYCLKEGEKLSISEALKLLS